MRPSKEINLFGKKLRLYSRDTRDVIALALFTGDQSQLEIHQKAVVVSDSLSAGFHYIPKWNLWERFSLKRYTSITRLERLSIAELTELFFDVIELEDGDIKSLFKKKKISHQLDGE